MIKKHYINVISTTYCAIVIPSVHVDDAESDPDIGTEIHPVGLVKEVRCVLVPQDVDRHERVPVCWPDWVTTVTQGHDCLQTKLWSLWW